MEKLLNIKEIIVNIRKKKNKEKKEKNLNMKNIQKKRKGQKFQ